MGLQGTQTDDQDQLQIVQLQRNDVPIQATVNIYQKCCDSKSFGEVDQLDFGLHFDV